MKINGLHYQNLASLFSFHLGQYIVKILELSKKIRKQIIHIQRYDL